MTTLNTPYPPGAATGARPRPRDRNLHRRRAARGEGITPVMGPANRAPVSIMGAATPGAHPGVMGGPDTGPRVSVMGIADRGVRLDVFGESDHRFVDSLFTPIT